MVRDGIQCANERHSMRRGGRVRDVAERIKKIIAKLLGVDKAQVTENAIFIDDLGADSLEAVELVMAFEEAFRTRSTSSKRIRTTRAGPEAGAK